KRRKSDNEEGLQVAETNGRPNIIVPLDFFQVVCRIAAGGDFPMIVLARQAAVLDLFRYEVFTDPQLRTVPVEDAGHARPKLPRADECLVVHLPVKIDDFRADQYLPRGRKVNGLVNVVGGE